jgi:hypothetical protein
MLQRYLYFLYIDDVRTSQETTYGPARPVTRIALLFYIQMIFIPHRKHAYGALPPVTRIALLYCT